MKPFQRTVFRSLTLAIRAYQRLFLDLHVWGRHRIPPGPKIFITNHITSTDPYWVLPFFGEPVHVIIGPGYQSRALARVLDWMEQINAMPAHRHTVVDKSVELLRRGGSIYTAPEGDLQPTFQLGRFYPGVAKIYRRFPAPIIPIALHAPRRAMRAMPRFDMRVEDRVYRAVFVLRGPFRIHIGEPFMPEVRADEDETAGNERIMEELKERVRRLVEEVRTDLFWL